MSIIGDFNSQPNIGLPCEYFEGRNITLDCRARDSIRIDSVAGISLEAKIITLSHRPNEGFNGALVERPVQIDAGAWIGAYAILYNTHVGKNSIVSIGAVVASRDVPANTMVEGNPARVIAIKFDGKWKYLDEPVELPRRK